MNDDKFRIFDRVFFSGKYGLGYFGNIEKIDHDGQKLLVRTDDMRLYEISIDKVTLLKHRIK
jgi:hypothetical protein